MSTISLKLSTRDKQFITIMAASNARGIDATSVGTSLLNLNHFLAFKRAKNTPFIPDFLVILKMWFIWFLARNVACNTWDLPLPTLELGFIITNLLCSQTTCEVAIHFTRIPHTLGDFSFQCIDQVQAPSGSEEIDRLLITKEAYWSAQLFSLAPPCLNKRKEFHSKNRICYN